MSEVTPLKILVKITLCFGFETKSKDFGEEYLPGFYKNII